MSPATSSALGVVAYLALFAGVGLVFLAVGLLAGRFFRPSNPFPEKGETYECGEPSIGSSFVQFDLRFYVVALLFIIFDVEVAYFFPWATVFGKSTLLAERQFEVVVEPTPDAVTLTAPARSLYQELGVREPRVIHDVPATLRKHVPEEGGEAARLSALVHAGGRQLALVTIVDILVFFAVLLVGFAYVWRRGDLDWVRALSRQRVGEPPTRELPAPMDEPILTA